MRNYIEMKKNEWKLKAIIYSSIITFVDNQKDILEFLKKMYTSLKDVPADQLQKEFISRLAELAHEDNKKDE